ncbi:MAG: hypothetical protein ABI954_09440 [Pyrinomonadaceae bacterium]
MKKVLKDLLPARETKIQIPLAENSKDEELFAVCLETDDSELLVPLKIYQVILRGKNIRVTDEKGEVAVYPRSFFLLLKLPQEDVSALTKVHAQAA